MMCIREMTATDSNDITPARMRMPARMTDRSDFRRVFRFGRRFRAGFLQLVYNPYSGKRNGHKRNLASRFGLVVSDAVIRHSVGRNRIKRLIRESVRRWWRYVKPGYDVAFQVKDTPEINHAIYVEAVFLRVMLKSGLLTEDGSIEAKERLSAFREEDI